MEAPVPFFPLPTEEGPNMFALSLSWKCVLSPLKSIGHTSLRIV